MSPLLLVHVSLLAVTAKKFLLLVALALLVAGMVLLFVGKHQYRRLAALGAMALGSVSTFLFLALAYLGTVKSWSAVMAGVGLLLTIAGLWRFERPRATGGHGGVRRKRGRRRSHREPPAEPSPQRRS